MEATLQDTETKPETLEIGRATREGLKGLLKAQNILLDYANEQNAIAFKAVRERLKAGESSPAAALIDSVEEIFEGVVAMQKSIVDFGTDRVSREPEAKDEKAVEPVEKKRTFPKFPFGELMRKNFEATVAAQREILGLIEKQGKLGVKTADEFSRFSARKTMKTVAAATKESIENMLDTQTRLIDLAARRSKDSIALIADQEKSLISKDLARYAEEGIDNLRRAQTKLIKIAEDMNERAYERVESVVNESEPAEPTTSKLAERVQSGIERVIKTQNEMLDASLRAVNRNTPAKA